MSKRTADSTRRYDIDWITAALRACDGFPLNTLENLPPGELYRIYLLHLSMPAVKATGATGQEP